MDLYLPVEVGLAAGEKRAPVLGAVHHVALDDGLRHLELAAEAPVGVRPHALPPQPVVGHTQGVQPRAI